MGAARTGLGDFLAMLQGAVVGKNSGAFCWKLGEGIWCVRIAPTHVGNSPEKCNVPWLVCGDALVDELEGVCGFGRPSK